MALIPTPAELKTKVAFERRANGENVGGVVKEGWQSLGIVRSSRVLGRLGGEGVLAARSQGSSPAEITVRACSKTRSLTTDDRAIEVHPLPGAAARIWNVRSIVAIDGGADWLNLLCEEDGGDGD